MKVDPRFKDTEYVVEADDFAMQCLWEKFSTQSMFRTPLNTYRWEQDCRGWMDTVDWLNKMPVVICVYWYKINGHLIAFYHPTSQVVDWNMLREYMEKYCKPKHNGSVSHCNATNFGQVLSYIRDCEAKELLDKAKKEEDKNRKAYLLELCWTEYPWAYDQEIIKLAGTQAAHLKKLRPSNGAER